MGGAVVSHGGIIIGSRLRESFVTARNLIFLASRGSDSIVKMGNVKMKYNHRIAYRGRRFRSIFKNGIDGGLRIGAVSDSPTILAAFANFDNALHYIFHHEVQHMNTVAT